MHHSGKFNVNTPSNVVLCPLKSVDSTSVRVSKSLRVRQVLVILSREYQIILSIVFHLNLN